MFELRFEGLLFWGVVAASRRLVLSVGAVLRPEDVSFMHRHLPDEPRHSKVIPFLCCDPPYVPQETPDKE